MRKKTSDLNQWMSCNMQTIQTIYAIAIAFTFASIANAAQQPKICIDIHKILIQRQQGYEPKDFYIEYQEKNGLDIYQGLDIDGDKIADSVEMSCAGSPDSGCFLTVNISSTGKKLELEEERFFLGRVKSSVYIIVGESLSEKEKNKRGKRRIYQVTKQTIKLICSHI